MSVVKIEKMSTAEKLEAMERLWDSLCKDEPDSPVWHEDVLKEREAKLQNGEDEFIPWDEAKRQLRARHR